jgi:hypothetical protein
MSDYNSSALQSGANSGVFGSGAGMPQISLVPSKGDNHHQFLESEVQFNEQDLADEIIGKLQVDSTAVKLLQNLKGKGSYSDRKLNALEELAKGLEKIEGMSNTNVMKLLEIIEEKFNQGKLIVTL